MAAIARTKGSLLLLISGTILIISEFSEAATIRGVSITRQGFYNPNKHFTCFDSSQTIPFSSVNDDYCDCADGSDEPGTSACPHMTFHCTNAGHRPQDIQSSRVNDGICDCCDGSDEYDSSVACFNSCKEQGRQDREQKQQEMQAHAEGYKIKLEYMESGKAKKTEQKQKLETLNAQLEERRSKLEELRAKKEEAETPEKAAKDKHQQEWDALKEKLAAEKAAKESEEAFGLLDTDKDGSLTTSELMNNNYLSEELDEAEATDMLGGASYVAVDAFTGLWNSIKSKFTKEGRPTEPAAENPDEASEEDGKKESEPKEDEEAPIDPPPQDSGDKDPEMPDYSDETKMLIEAAEQARRDFDEAERAVTEAEREQRQVNDYFEKDYGTEEEFQSLHGQCFEISDREYTYKLCPFDKVTQRQKSGGAETDLGRFGSWVGTANKYTGMKYEGGTGCWKGPARSTMVELACGSDNKVITVGEPNRCEYAMQFITPALCQKIEPHPHTEL